MNDWRRVSAGIAHQWWCDHYGHVNVRWYAHLFDDASFAFWALCGVGRDVLLQTGVHTVVARTETDLRRELLAGQTFQVVARWGRLGDKSVAIELRLLSLEDEALLAEQRVVEVFFDPATRRSTAMPPSIRGLLEQR